MTAPARWTTRGDDPTSAEMIGDRLKRLHAIARPPISDRIPYLRHLASGKKVLDVGCVEHAQSFAERPGWLHGQLHHMASYCLGVDILPREVLRLREQGYDVLCHDFAAEGPLSERFDLIVCGEVLEHVDDAGRFLRTLGSMVKPNGSLILTLPNPYYINTVLRNTHGGDWSLGNVDHVAWFDPPEVCELADRAGLTLAEFRGVWLNRVRTAKGKLMRALFPLVVRLGARPELFCPTILYRLQL